MKNLLTHVFFFFLAGICVYVLRPGFASAESQSGLQDALATSLNTDKSHDAPPENLQKALYWFEKGSLYATYGNHTAAVESYRKALAADPHFTEAYFNLGVVYGEMGHFQEGLEAINRAIGSMPDSGRYYYGRGWLFLRSGDTAKAMSDMQAAAGLGNPEAKQYLQEIATRKN